MDLIDRYLQAVRGYLPKRDQDDIIRELAEDVRSQLDEREAEVGRSLTKTEVEAFLQQLGHPMVLAARFGPQRQLIGPAIFPFYWRTLTIALGVGLLVHVVVAAVSLISGRAGQEIVERLVRFPTTVAVTIFGWVTIVFAAGEWGLTRTKVLVSWDPSTLPPVRSDAPQVSRLKVVAEIASSAAGVAYLLALPGHPWLLFGPGALFLQVGPVWDRFYVPVVVLVSVSLVVPVLNLFRPDWTRLRVVSRLAVGATGLVILSLLMDAGPYVVLKDAASAKEYGEAVAMLNTGIRISLAITWLITAVDLVREGLRFWRAQRREPSQA